MARINLEKIVVNNHHVVWLCTKRGSSTSNVSIPTCIRVQPYLFSPEVTMKQIIKWNRGDELLCRNDIPKVKLLMILEKLESEAEDEIRKAYKEIIKK